MNAVMNNIGLILFVVVVIMNVIGLLLDFILMACGYMTISWWADKYPVITWVIVIWQLIGVGSIAYHLKLE